MFNLEELKELKHCANSMISVRISYLHSNISDKEKSYTSIKLEEDYLLLSKILELISKEESK